MNTDDHLGMEADNEQNNDNVKISATSIILDSKSFEYKFPAHSLVNMQIHLNSKKAARKF